MSRLERPRGPQEKQSLRASIEQYKAECTPTFSARALTDLSPSFLNALGVSTLLLDAEGTFVPFDGLHPDERTVKHLNTLRKSMPDLKIAVVTNERVKDPASFVKVTLWGEKVGAKVVVTPQDSTWRKPSPKMLDVAISELGIPDTHRDDVLMIGDKLTGDIRAANRAGIRSIWLGSPLGETDHLGDKLVRRPFEQSLARAHRVPLLEYDDPSLSTAYPLFEVNGETKTSSHSPEEDAVLSTQEWWNKHVLDRLVALNIPNVIYGFGIPATPSDKDQRVLGSRWLYENGGNVADFLSDVRVPLAVAGAFLETRKHPKTAAAVKALKMMTDMIDGSIARKSRRGATSEGAKKDQTRDKEAGFITEMGMVAADTLSPGDFFFRVASDYTMNNMIRPDLDGKGISTSAVLPGKLATGIVDVMNVISPLVAQESPWLARILNEVATSAKVARLLPNKKLMEQRHIKRTDQAEELNLLLAELLLKKVS